MKLAIAAVGDWGGVPLHHHHWQYHLLSRQTTPTSNL